jgi:hypothetical protein
VVDPIAIRLIAGSVRVDEQTLLNGDLVIDAGTDHLGFLAASPT